MAAKAYRALLVDPCNAPLTTPVWGSDGSYLQKFETFLTVGTGASQTAGYIWWSPGSISATAKTALVTGVSADASTSITWASTSDKGGDSPGYTFLNNATARLAGDYRCVAACAQVVTLVTEYNRQGYLSVGSVANSAVYGQDVSVGGLQSLLPGGGRMPSGQVEAIWVPSNVDEIWQDANDAIGAQQVDRRKGIVIAYTGVPASTASLLQIKLTMIAQWRPRANLGISQPPPAPRASGNSLSDVVSSVPPDQWVRWFEGGTRIAYNLAARAYYGGMGGPPRRQLLT
jgi:hypothetical protein